MRRRTWALHTTAERTGVVADLIRGRANQAGYALYLHNLLPVYEELERGLDRHRQNPALAALAVPEIYRAAAIRADLADMTTPGNETVSLSLLPSGETYASRVRDAADGDGAGLIAHAYVRYLGDLNGGRLLKRKVALTLQLPASSLSFYDFAVIADISAFTTRYRAAFDDAERHGIDVDAVLNEAETAFALNIALSEAVALHDAHETTGHPA